MLTPQDKQWFLQQFHDSKTWQFDQFHRVNVGIGLLIARVNDIESQIRLILSRLDSIESKLDQILKQNQTNTLGITFDPPVQK